MKNLLIPMTAWVTIILFPLLCQADEAKASRCVFGALQNDPRRIEQNYQAGLRLAVLELAWSRYEPREGVFNAGYIAQQKQRLQTFRAGGMQMVLDFGVQYPPAWLLEMPDSRYVNQYGDAFVDTTPGKNIGNMVFNRALRDRQAAYMRRVFTDFGTDFFAVRLGGGWYSELNYPPHRFKERQNCYWAFDALAQGQKPGLPEGVRPCPVPAWIPGMPSDPHPDDKHRAARRFIDWYLDSLKNYHDWQIATARRSYAGRLAMLYPSWGIRPGQLEAAIAVDLNGTTSPEKNGEIQRGFDFARFIAGIQDRGVVVYCTWLDANPRFSNENSPDPARWSPVHYLASLAQAHPLHLAVWGENTGQNDDAAMRLCFTRMKAYDLIGVMWAFEHQLYDGKHASLDLFAKLIAEFCPDSHASQRAIPNLSNNRSD
ncbi:MAG: beta-galactosidase [Armatimonadota bacterium]|nr:beta-galactosidase [Armatimonadota bacterium]